MTFEVGRWPLPDDIDRYQLDLKVPRDAIVRDIARLITVAQMVHHNDLNDDLVLTGGMAMRPARVAALHDERHRHLTPHASPKHPIATDSPKHSPSTSPS